MEYFESKVVKAVQTWQRSDSEVIHGEVLSRFFMQLSENLQRLLHTELTISDVSH